MDEINDESKTGFVKFHEGEQISLWRAACKLSGQHWAETTPSAETIEKAQRLCLEIAERRLVTHKVVAHLIGIRIEIPQSRARIGPAVFFNKVAYHAEGIEDWSRIRIYLIGYTIAQSAFAAFESKLVQAKNSNAIQAGAKSDATAIEKEDLPTKPVALARNVPRGGDALTRIIWEICYDLRDAGTKSTPIPVMAQLKIRADSNDPSVKGGTLLSSIAGGVKYDDINGDEQELNSNQLQSRINAWKKANTVG